MLCRHPPALAASRNGKCRNGKMTTESRGPTSPPLTERQEARRRRILHTSAQLARRGGFDAVQMREVAESSSVALGTLYRYFPSKVHLLVATMQDQLQHMHETLRKRPPPEGPRRAGRRDADAGVPRAAARAASGRRDGAGADLRGPLRQPRGGHGLPADDGDHPGRDGAGRTRRRPSSSPRSASSSTPGTRR